jgi:hypothetical protein
MRSSFFDPPVEEYSKFNYVNKFDSGVEGKPVLRMS